MPVSFRSATTVTVHVPTLSGSLVTSVSGVNATGGVAVNLEEGDVTGYTNTFTDYSIPGYYSPRVLKRWQPAVGGYELIGEASLKVDTRYTALISSGSHLTFNNVDWTYRQYTEMGAGFGNDRIVLALTRKRSA